MTRIHECILYRDFAHGEILEQMGMLIDAAEFPEELQKKREIYFSLHQWSGGNGRKLWIFWESLAQLPDISAGKPRKCF